MSFKSFFNRNSRVNLSYTVLQGFSLGIDSPDFVTVEPEIVGSGLVLKDGLTHDPKRAIAFPRESKAFLPLKPAVVRDSFVVQHVKSSGIIEYLGIDPQTMQAAFYPYPGVLFLNQNRATNVCNVLQHHLNEGYNLKVVKFFDTEVQKIARIV